MFVGVGIAFAASIAVGVGLDLVSAALPQAQQEMLETVIGGIAVVFVTTMIIWMNRNAFHLKGELEHDAAQAINTGGSLALAVMAFLAVLKEGFETAVFLLAAVQATHGSHWSAVAGGVAGIAVAVGIGVGLFFGAVKVNLGRFFRITGIFLVFIAAGLVMSSLRTAHEAGWITIGQQKVADLSSWMSARSVLGALVTGMFGIPTDPRLIEVLGWALYAVPVLLVFLWPARLTPTATARRRLLAGVATALAAAAVVLAVADPAGAGGSGPVMRTVTDAGGQRLSVAVASNSAGRSLVVTPSAPGASAQRIPLADAGSQTVGGMDVAVWQAKVPADPGQTAGDGHTGPTRAADGRPPAGRPVPLPHARTVHRHVERERRLHRLDARRGRRQRERRRCPAGQPDRWRPGGAEDGQRRRSGRRLGHHPDRGPGDPRPDRPVRPRPNRTHALECVASSGPCRRRGRHSDHRTPDRPQSCPQREETTE